MKTTAGNWMFFLGALFLLMGAYGFIRIVHVSVRKVPYPSAGVLPTNILFTGAPILSFSRESDCESYPAIYYKEDNTTPRQPLEEEKMLEQKNTERCIRGFDEERAKTKQYDKNLSAFLVFVGAGLILSRQFIE